MKADISEVNYCLIYDVIAGCDSEPCGELRFFLSFPTHLTGVDSLSLNWLRVVFASI